MSMYRQYTGVSPSDELELTLRGGDVVNLQINSLSRNPSINSSWVDLDLLPGWQRVMGASTPQALNSAGITYLSGVVASETVGTISPIFRLPLVFRPKRTKFLGSHWLQRATLMTVDPNGFVTPTSYWAQPSGAISGLCLDSLIFPNM